MLPLLYRDLTGWYRLVDPPADHLLETERHREALARGLSSGKLETLLELGAGAGHNAVHLKKHLRCTLTDLSADMSRLSRELNPECEHALGDMRDLRLGRMFDAVLIHDAVMYMTTKEDLAAAAKTAFAHTRPGGAALFAPDCVRETFREMTELEGSDDGARSARFMMWSWDPDPTDDTYVVDFSFLLRDGTDVRAVHDRHIEGVFSRAIWREVLESAGFAVEFVSQKVEDGRVEELVLCSRPA